MRLPREIRDRFPLFVAIAVVLLFTVLQNLLYVPIGHNDASRWNTAYSLVHHGQYAFKEVPWPQTVDQMLIEVDGERRFVSSKPAFWATIVAPVYWVASGLGWKMGESELSTKAAIDFVLFWVNLVPFGVAVYWFLRFCQVHRLSDRSLLAAALLVCSGTYMTGYLFTLNNHLPAAIFTMGSLWYLFRGQMHALPRAALACGLFAGLAFCVELSASLWVVVLAAVWTLKRPGLLIHYLMGAGLALGSFFLIERLAYGWWLPNQLQHLLGWGSKVYYDGSPWTEAIKSVPIHNIDESFFVKLFHMTFGHHGVFALTPIFMISLYGMVLRWRAKPNHRLALGLIFAVPFLVILIYARKTDNYGGVCQGLRWVLWLTPIWLWQIPKVLEHRGDSRPWQVLLAVAWAVSTYSAVTALTSPWTESWWHAALRSSGLVSY